MANESSAASAPSLASEDWVITASSLAVLLLSTAIAIHLGGRRSYSKNLPPGPTPLPILGNLLSLGTKPHVGLQKLAEKYGPVMTVYFGTTPAVVLSEPEVFKEAMISKGTATAGRPLTPTTRIALHNGADIAFGDYGANWRKMRKAVVTDLLHKSEFMKRSSIMMTEVMRAKNAIKVQCSSNGGKACLSPRRYLRSTTINVIYSIVFGRTIEPGNPESDPELHELDQAFQELFETIGLGAIEDFMPLLHILPTPHMTRIRSVTNTRDRILMKFIHERRERRSTGAPGSNNLLDVLLERQEERGMSQKDLLFIVNDLVSAGTDTSGTTLEWLLLLMADNPASQDTVQVELDEIFGDEVPSTIDADKLPVLHAAIMEAMRIKAVGPLLVPHQTRQDLTLGGYHIPANTPIHINNMAMAMSPKYWDRPEEFRLERFLEEEKHLKLRNVDGGLDAEAYKFVPFGAGPRHCPGREMAVFEMTMIAAHLLHAFRWAPADGHVNLEEKFGLTLEPMMSHQKLRCSLRH